jgi:hypothetical protein
MGNTNAWGEGPGATLGITSPQGKGKISTQKKNKCALLEDIFDSKNIALVQDNNLYNIFLFCQ